MIQLILGGVILLALGGAWFTHEAGVKATGKAEAEAVYQKQQADAEKENARLAEEGKQAAIDLWQAAEEKSQAQAAKIKSLTAARKAADDAQVAKDPVYRAWASEPVPAYVADRLRAAIVTAAADQGGDHLPSATGLSPAASVPDPTGAPNKSWVQRLRSRLSATGQGSVGSSGPDGK